LTNGHNRLATGTIKTFSYEMFTVCSLLWKVKRVLSCVVLIMEFTVLVSVLLLTVLVPSLEWALPTQTSRSRKQMPSMDRQ